jgi:hypothetical protein
VEELVWAIVVSAPAGVVVVSDVLDVLEARSRLLKHAGRLMGKYPGSSRV